MTRGPLRRIAERHHSRVAIRTGRNAEHGPKFFLLDARPIPNVDLDPRLDSHLLNSIGIGLWSLVLGRRVDPVPSKVGGLRGDHRCDQLDFIGSNDFYGLGIQFIIIIGLVGPELVATESRALNDRSGGAVDSDVSKKGDHTFGLGLANGVSRGRPHGLEGDLVAETNQQKGCCTVVRHLECLTLLPFETGRVEMC